MTSANTTDPVDPVPAATGRQRGLEDADASEEVQDVDLLPGLRDRLIQRLDRAGIPPRGRLAYVAALTRRAVQTVSRWFDPRRPGLPDVASFARLCHGLGCSADWLLGLASATARSSTPMQNSTTEIRWVGEVLAWLRGAYGNREAIQMIGDEMAPAICDRDLLFVDRSQDRVDGNGIYAVQIDGRVLVRRIENRVGAGIVVKCDNPAYDDYSVGDAEAAERMGLRVIGKVYAVVGTRVFWHNE